MPAIVVIGAGGHARVCLDVLSQQHDLTIVGCLGAEAISGLPTPLLGGIDALPGLRSDGIGLAFVALGDNETRRQFMSEAASLGFRLANAVSDNAYLSPGATIGSNVLLMPGSVVNAGASIGDGVIVNTSASVDHDCRIGPYVHVAPGVHLGGDTTVEEGALLGIGTTVLPGRVIGTWSTVGAGSVVTRDVPSRTTVKGNPAR